MVASEDEFVGPRLVLPDVDGWPPPPMVTVPVYGLADWPGPRWLIVFDDDGDGRLARLTLAYGDEASHTITAEVVIHAKWPRKDLGDGLSISPASLEQTADNMIFLLLSHVSSGMPPRRRHAWIQEQDQVLGTAMPDGRVGPPVWNGFTISVDDRTQSAHLAEVNNGWAICADLDAVFLGACGVGAAPQQFAVASLSDLSSYPMPTEADDSYFSEPESDEQDDPPPPPSAVWVDIDVEPTRTEDLTTYLNARFPCHGYEHDDSRDDGSVHYTYVCGEFSDWYDTAEAAIEVLDDHLDELERQRQDFIVDWFSRYHPDMPVHINGVRRR